METKEILIYLRPFLLLFSTVIAIAILGRIFGGHFFKYIIEGMKKEFTTRMGIISLLGFLIFVFFMLDISVFEHIISIFSEHQEHQSQDMIFTLIWSMVVVLLGNFIFIGILSKK